MQNGSGRAWRGLTRACVQWGLRGARRIAWTGALLMALAAPEAMAQTRQEGAPLDGRGGVVALASGDGHSCAIRNDGTVACWGANYAGQATPPEGRFIALSAGTMHTCGLRDDGRLECWGGLNLPPMPEGERYVALSGNGHYVCTLSRSRESQCHGWTPFQVPQLQGVTALATTERHACGLMADGTAQCWGDDAEGATSPPWGTYTAIAVGWDRGCALRAEGTLACWGRPFDQSQPPQDARYTAISLGREHGCGLRQDGTLQCWGGGDVTPPQGRYLAVSAGAYHTCALRTDGGLACWGEQFQGATEPPQGVFGVGSLDAGAYHTCQVRPDGTPSCWGREADGQSQPPPGERFVEINAATVHSCGRLEDGRFTCWGANDDNQSAPPAGVSLRGASLALSHGCGLAEDGTAHCWGWNAYGQATPPVDAFHTLGTGFVHSCGVRADGTAQCWGYDGNNQLMLPPPPWGQEYARIVSMQSNDWGNCALFTTGSASCTGLGWGGTTATLDDVRAYGMGAAHVCWIDSEGSLHCEGTGPVLGQPVPEGRFVSVSSGTSHSCAIRSDGARVCWGDDSEGQVPQLRIEPMLPPALAMGESFLETFELLQSTPDGLEIARAGTFAVTQGTLPEGLVLSPEGVLSGTPVQAGEFPLTIQARDADGFVVTRPMMLRIDGTPPQVSAVVEGPRGDNDWYVGPVSIRWQLEDADSWVYGELGCEDTTWSADALDAAFTCTARSAGGTATGVVSVKLDAAAPDTGIGAGPEPQSSQATATFDFDGDDEMSGLARFECSLDSTPFATCTSPLQLSGLASGEHVFAVRAVDKAGNVDATPALHHWRIDATAPVVTPHVSGPQGANGWYVGDVTVSWTVQDPDSPLQSLSGCETVTLRTDSPGASFTCTASSTGGSASQTVTVKRDTTAPVINAAAMTSPNSWGWYRGDVTVAFGCSDAVSGVVACPASQVIGGEGTSLSSTPVTVFDAAGNATTSDIVTVRIDRTAPTLAPVAPATVLLNAAATATANGNDALSGVDAQSCPALVTGSVGLRTTTCTVTDRAGNTASAGAAYRVTYGFNGFTSPVQNAPVLNVLKAGRSVSLQWRLVDANGAPVTNLASASVNPVSIGCPTATENRISVYGGTSAALQNLGNGYYRLDWFAASSLRNLCRRLELNLGDGQLRTAQFKFN